MVVVVGEGPSRPNDDAMFDCVVVAVDSFPLESRKQEGLCFFFLPKNKKNNNMTEVSFKNEFHFVSRRRNKRSPPHLSPSTIEKRSSKKKNGFLFWTLCDCRRRGRDAAISCDKHQAHRPPSNVFFSSTRLPSSFSHILLHVTGHDAIRYKERTNRCTKNLLPPVRQQALPKIER